MSLGTGQAQKEHLIPYIVSNDISFPDFSTDHRGTPEQPGRVVTVIERKFWETLDDPVIHLPF